MNPRTALMKLILLLTAACPLLAQVSEEQPKPFGLEKRFSWTASRLAGSPEPPLPFTVERTFTNLTWKAPLYVADEPGSDRLWIVLQGGDNGQPSRILRIQNDPATAESATLLERPGQLIYSVAFHPRFETNGFFYLFTNGPRAERERTNRVTRFALERSSLPDFRINSETTILEWRSAGHDGGDMAFGLDGKFYITTGDGTSDSDTWVSGQTLDDLLGAVLRIDVDHPGEARPYSIPADNPFLNLPGALPEIWAYGLRNPWRLGIDATTGHVWVGNNGQDLWETAHLVRPGENYGWSVYEGSHPFYLNRQLGPTPLTHPTIEHHHSEFRSLTGGVVYYGEKWRELNGVYVYGDYATGRIWGARHDGERLVWHQELADTSLQIAAFRVDQQGELLIVDHAGGIYRLARSPRKEFPFPFPERLSETGLFESVSEYRTDPALIPYSINAPAWTDGAKAERFLALPGEAKAAYDRDRGWNFDDGTVVMQTLRLEREPGYAASAFLVETRVLLRQQGEWAGYSYRWNEEQSDATLVPKGGAEAQFTIKDAATPGGTRQQTWRFPSRSECMACHSRAANYLLGLTGLQMNRDHIYGEVADNQLRALQHIGLFKSPPPAPPASSELEKNLLNPYDPSGDLETRARSYLHVNCSVCHVEAGGGNAQLELHFTRPRDRMNLIDARPQHDTFGVTNAMLVAAGDPDRSILLHRLARRGRGQMPPLASAEVDAAAVKLIRDWIAQMQPSLAFVRDWQMADLLPELGQLKSGRSFARGASAFRATGCNQCHRFAGEGGSVGPDLSGIGRRLSPRELLESILTPSAVIPEAFASFEIETRHGESHSGRIEREDDQVLVLRPPVFGEAAIQIHQRDILSRKQSQVSNMPVGMVNVLEKEPLLDLLAYLLNDANPEAQAFVRDIP